MTIQDGVERCLKKGKGEEQAQAASCVVLLCVQMGAGDESEEIFKQLRSMLTTVMSDSSASLKARTAVSIELLCSMSLFGAHLIRSDNTRKILTSMGFVKSCVLENQLSGAHCNVYQNFEKLRSRMAYLLHQWQRPIAIHMLCI